MNDKISMDHNTHENSLMNYSDGNTRVDNENETIILNDNKENTSMQSYQVTHFNQDKHLNNAHKSNVSTINSNHNIELQEIPGDPTKSINNEEIKDIEKELDNLQQNKINSDGTTNIKIYRNLLISLHEQVNRLEQEVEFLRNDTLMKSKTIKNLVSMISIKVNKPNSNEQSTLNETSSYNSMVSQYNNNVVAFNENLREESQTNYQCSTPITGDQCESNEFFSCRYISTCKL